jgi:hypothetical protein
MSPNVQLLAYRFGAGTTFDGQVVGALERLEVGGAVRVLDVLVVGRDDASGELFGIATHGAPTGGSLARLLTFRLDAAERSRATRGVPADLLAALGDHLAAGEVIMAILVGQEWARTLESSVARLGGTALPSTLVAQASFDGLAHRLLGLVSGRPA